MKCLTLILFSLLLIFTQPALQTTPSQTRERIVNQTKDDVVKVDVDLIVLDALVMQKKTSRVVGNLKRDDFTLSEDGVKQQITHFSQDTLPLSILLLVDRGGCLDPFGSQIRRAALEALSRLKPTDEVALMTYHDSVQLVKAFTYDRAQIAAALDRVPDHEEEANHCLNRAFHQAAEYIVKASNPVGRRVILVITGITSNFDCAGPSNVEVTHAVLESGSVVCGLIPRSPGQRFESGATRVATGVAGLFKLRSLSINKLAEETGGEVLGDKPENLDRAFNTLVSHLRTRYSMGFVSSNKKYDGSLRKLKLEISPAVQKAAGKLVVKTRRSYIAPKRSS